jgi:hypothetical protein
MTIHLPEDLESSILAAVRSGRYASVDDAMIQAVHLLLRQPPAVPSKPVTEQEFEQRLIESGFLGSVPPPRDQATSGWSFDPVKIEGEPLSETIIRERR